MVTVSARLCAAVLLLLFVTPHLEAQEPPNNAPPTATVEQLDPNLLITVGGLNPITGVDGGVSVTLRGSGNDPEGGNTALRYAWTQIDSSGVTINLDGADTATPSFTTPARTAGELNLAFQLIVTDSAGLSSPNVGAIVDLRVFPLGRNLPPTGGLCRT